MRLNASAYKNSIGRKLQTMKKKYETPTVDAVTLDEDRIFTLGSIEGDEFEEDIY